MTLTWQQLDAQTIAALPAQLGMFELRDGDQAIVEIGYAGGLEPFGLRSALAARLTEGPSALEFRVEYTHAYLTRWAERLMEHQRDHGTLPDANAGDERHLGRLDRAHTKWSTT